MRNFPDIFLLLSHTLITRGSRSIIWYSQRVKMSIFTHVHDVNTCKSNAASVCIYTCKLARKASSSRRRNNSGKEPISYALQLQQRPRLLSRCRTISKRGRVAEDNVAKHLCSIKTEVTLDYVLYPAAIAFTTSMEARAIP